MWAMLLLLIAASLSGPFLFQGASSAPAPETLSNFPHVVLVLHINSNTRYTGVLISAKYVLTHSSVGVGKTAADIGIFVGDATKATMVKPFKFFANAHVAILKVCPKGDWPTTFLDLTPSAFYDFASGDAPAKHIFFDTGKVLTYSNTTALKDTNCPLESSLYGDVGMYTPASVGCTSGRDATVRCQFWLSPTTCPFCFSVLAVNSQIVGIYLDSRVCYNSDLWTASILYTKILPQRDFIMQTIV